MSAINVQIEERLALLNETFDKYWKLKSDGLQGAIKKAGHNFRVYSTQSFKAIAPPKGKITSSNLDRMRKKGSDGLIVSDRAKQIVTRKFGIVQSPITRQSYITGSGKRGISKAQRELIEGIEKATRAKGGVKGGTIQALMVRQELRLRESHTFFLASAFMFKGDLTQTTYSRTRKGGAMLGQAIPLKSNDAASLTFRWGPAVSKWSAHANEGINTPKGQASLSNAIKLTTEDMQKYINGKIEKALKRQQSINSN